MRLQHVMAIAIVTGTSGLLAACGGTESTAADEAAIRDINKNWQELIVSKDAAAIAKVYAEDGEMLPPNAPKAVGREQIEKSWKEVVSIPGVQIAWTTERVILAKSGDLAVETQTYKFATADVTENGKVVVTWHKKDNKWEVLTDMWSSDATPAAPAAPAPAAPAEATPAPAEAPAAPATPPAH